MLEEEEEEEEEEDCVCSCDGDGDSDSDSSDGDCGVADDCAASSSMPPACVSTSTARNVTRPVTAIAAAALECKCWVHAGSDSGGGAASAAAVDEVQSVMRSQSNVIDTGGGGKGGGRRGGGDELGEDCGCVSSLRHEEEDRDGIEED